MFSELIPVMIAIVAIYVPLLLRLTREPSGEERSLALALWKGNR
jgi:hypothetical protein